MHTLTSDRDQVLKLMQNTIMKMQTTSPAGAASVGGGEEGDVLAKLNSGYMEEQTTGGTAAAASLGFEAQQNQDWYVPRNQAVAVFQAIMDEYLEEQGAPEAPAKSGGASAASTGAGELSHAEIAANVFYGGEAPGGGGGGAMAAALMEQFDNLDPRWASWVWVKATGWLKGKHKFTTHTSPTDFRFDMNDEATIAVVGDWGGGNEAAQAVADQIKKIAPDHIIHLGDVYYAGTPKETQERFLKYWPTPREPGKSFALNSNHEMYGGGYGYFDITLPTFKQPASYFSLANQNWRLIGLDTGYDEHQLHDPQAEWLAAQLQDDGRKNILFTHHQLFSAYESPVTTDCSKLQGKVQPFLDAGKIYGWIWGHEHLCVVYQDYMGIMGVCLGNGCFPYNPPTIQPRVPVEWLNNRAQPDDPDYRGIHTFALMKITPQQIDIQYIDQDGTVGHTQTWK
jgi:hypothetical protein